MKNITTAVVYDGSVKMETKMKIYGQTLVETAKSRSNIVCLCADLTKQTEVDGFRDTFPDRFFSMGMAEQNMIGVASGMAQGGYTPFVNSFAVFLSRRPYDQIAMSVAYPKMNVKLVGIMPGLSSPGGASHQAIDDLAIMRATPNMTVIDVGEATEVAKVIPLIADVEGPVYLRLKRGELPVLLDESGYKLEIGESYLLKEGDKVGIVTSGLMTEKALAAHHLLALRGFRVSVLHVPSIKPIDENGIRLFAKEHEKLFTLDNHNIIGGLGSAVLEVLGNSGISTPVERIGVRDIYAQAASAAFLYRKHSMDSDQIAETLLYHLTGKQEDIRQDDQLGTDAKGWGGSF